MARSELLLAGYTDDTSRVVVTMADEVPVIMWRGWPAVANTVDSSVGHSDVSVLLDGIENFDIERTNTWLDMKAKGAANPDSCKLRYIEAGYGSVSYQVTVTTTDCS